DDIHFYVHSHILILSSSNSFGGHIVRATDSYLQPFAVAVPECSSVLTLVFLSIYGLPCDHCNFSLSILLTALYTLYKYGIAVDRSVVPDTSLFQQILAQAPLNPMEVYITAAELDLYPLACSISAYLLEYDIDSISDEQAVSMGSLYLKRIYRLHRERIRILKDLLSLPPKEHGPSLDCSYDDQQRLRRAWSLAIMSVMWDARAGK
ncbi:hypothetical protein K474DRAFT_1594731, partial [Panus rudis PR-1116 ss-1]